MAKQRTDLTVEQAYAPLSTVLNAAYDQAAIGKGKDRHARGKAFLEQPIMEIGRMVGPGYATGQAMKKLQEAKAMADRGQFDAAMHEILGAINYCAAAYILVDEAKTATSYSEPKLQAELAQSLASIQVDEKRTDAS